MENYVINSLVVYLIYKMEDILVRETAFLFHREKLDGLLILYILIQWYYFFLFLC